MGKDWDRFKKAFGVAPSKELVDNRDGKITVALAAVGVEIQRLRAEGLPTGALSDPRDDIDRRRLLALLLPSRKDQYAGLDDLKAEARTLAQQAPGVATGAIQVLTGDLVRLRGEIQQEVQGAERIVHPLCRAVIDGDLTTARDAATAAEQQATNAAKRDALADIDLQPLKDAVALARPAHQAVTQLGYSLGAVGRYLQGMADDDVKAGYTRELGDLTDQQADLANEDDLGRLRDRATALDADARALARRVGRTVSGRLDLAAARAAIELVVGPARAIRCDLAKEVVQEPLDALLDAIAAAEQLGGDDHDLAAALDTDDMRALRHALALAVAAARNLDAGVPKLLAGVAAVIAKVGDDGLRGGFEDELDLLRQRATALETELDPEALREGYDEVRAAAEELLDRAVRDAGGEAWRDALTARFGVTVTSERDGALVNLEGTYRALAAVPEGHVGHDKLDKVAFTGKPKHGGAYKDAKIDIDDFEVGYPYTYEIDGEPAKVDGFHVCMLHEIGHAVDDKHRIMKGLMDTAGAGDWHAENDAAVLQVLVDAALGAMDDHDQGVADHVRTAIDDALKGRTTVGGPRMSRGQKRALAKYTRIASSIIAKAEPWFIDDPGSIAVGQRVYVHTDRLWVSYALAEREARSVRNYQWRSPDEWFADLYGISWLKKRKVVDGVPDAVATWLPS